MDCLNHILKPLLAGLFVLVLATSANAATLNVPADFITIQAAVNAAAAGDTILVQSGTYYENVNVNKALTLRGVDSGSGLPVVDAGRSGDAIILRANNCTLQDFVAMNSSGQSGIRVLSSYNTISGNTAVGNYYGIAIRSSSIGNTISGNTATDNSYYGILLDSSSGNTISDNIATGNSNGIYLYFSSIGNTISGNTATGNTNSGICISSSSGNTISDNTAAGNSNYGIYLRSSSNGNTISGNTATGNTNSGICLSSSSSDNTITGNTATANNRYGIYLSSSSSNSISSNTATGNIYCGIYLYSSSGNTISDNTATGNAYGILLASSSNSSTINGNTATGNNNHSIYLRSSSNDNTIYLNTLDSGRSNGANHWNSTTEIAYGNATTYVGNIWSDYDGIDCDGDGIGDTAYPVAGGSDIDNHPIGGVLSSPGLEAENLADRSEAAVGDWINYTVHVNNTGNVNLTGVRVEDNLTGAIWNVGTLGPSQSYTNTIRYQVSLSDLPGPLINELQANGTDPCDHGVNDSAIEIVNITSYELLCISGYKLDECTGMGLAGWEIILTNSSSGEVDLTYTNATGHYQFCGLEPGDYDLSQTLKPGWMEVDAPGPITLGCYNLTDQNFRIEKLLCISGYKFDECTGMGLAGWETILTNSNGEVARTATNATGYYEFCGLRFGNYTVCEVLKAGWKNVTAECMYVELECEDIVVNFENIPPLCISGHEFNHCTGAGLDGWTINLKDGSGNVLYTTTTDGTGYYEFCGLEPGWYTVCEDNIPEGWTSFRDDLDSPVMSLPGTSASTEDYETPKCIVVNLDYCEDATDNDFENIPTFCIHGTIYNNSTTVSGFPVKIENSDGSLVLSIPTDENGEYSFCSLKGGSYTVCVDKPGWTADEPCAIVYLDCMDEEHDFDVYMGRSNILPGIEQPAITLGESTRAVVQGERSGEPTAAIEPVMGGDEEEGRQTQL